MAGGAFRSYSCLSRLKNMSLSLKSVPSFPEEAFVFAFRKAPKVPFEAAAAPSCFSVQRLVFGSNFSAATVAPGATFRSLGFSSSSSLSLGFRNKGSFPTNMVQRSVPYSTASVAKRIRRSEKMRIKNRARKSKVKARMNKYGRRKIVVPSYGTLRISHVSEVFEALDELKNKPDIQAEEMSHIERLIEKAHSTINKAVSAGVLHRNTGERRKARLARRKKVVEIQRGLNTPTHVVNAS